MTNETQERIKKFKEERQKMADTVIELGRMTHRTRIEIYVLWAVQFVEVLVLLYLFYSL